MHDLAADGDTHGGGTPFTVTLGSTTPGTFNFTIQGTDGTLTHATPTETLTVTGAASDFTWTDTGSATVTVMAGQTASFTFSAAPVGGGTFGSTVSFACSELPELTDGLPGASCVFNPRSIAAGAVTTAVTLTILTTGPNFGPADVRRRAGLPRMRSAVRQSGRARMGDRPYALPFFTLAWVVVAGMVGIGRKRRGKPRLYAGIAVVCLGLGLMALISCGGVTGTGSISPEPVTVTVNPGVATLFADETGNSWPSGVTQQQFTATVNNSTNQTVTWAVTGTSANGTIDVTTGLYTAPTVVPIPSATVTVTATSAAATAPGSAFVTVAPPTVLGASQITVTATAAGGASHADIVTMTVQ